MTREPSLHIVSGAPGTGKTTVLRSIGPGFTLVPEPARSIIRAWRSEHGTDGQPPADLFVAALLETSIDDHQTASGSRRTVVFDRGIPDCIAYAIHFGVDPTAAIDASRRLRYHPEVVVMRPWRQILTTDDMRRMTFEMVEAFDVAIDEAYDIAGYELVDVPRMPVDRRAAWIAQRLTGS